MNIIIDIFKAIALGTLYFFVAVLSIVIPELARDTYHFLSHSTKFKRLRKLHKLHANHHQITKGKAKDFSNLDLEKYISSQWQNDIPESFVMLIASFLLPTLVFFLFNF
jgi:hypothetical protein